MMANAAARRAAMPYLLPEMAHDHWVAVNAARNGKVSFIREPTILYRQHADNHSGANVFHLGYALSRLPGLVSSMKLYRKAVKIFPDATTAGLVYRKIWLNLRRFQTRDEF
jgi:hypothetical protein